MTASVAFPAAEPVARVASQPCPILSDSGMGSMKQIRTVDQQLAANGKLSNSDLSQSGVHLIFACVSGR